MSQLSSAAVAGAGRAAVNTDVLDYELDTKTRDALGRELEAAVPSPYGDPERAIREAARIFRSCMSEDFMAALERFALDPASRSTMRISGLPIDSVLPPTPADGQDVSAKKTFGTEGVLMGMGRVLGHPFAFKEEKQGKIVQQVAPVPKLANELSNASSLTGLGMHVENSFSEFRPHYLLLFCLRGDPDHKAMTRIASGDAIASRLSPEHLENAKRPEFRIQCPASFKTPDGKPMFSDPVAILSGPPQYLELRLDLPEYTQCLTDRATETYAAIQTALAEPGVVLDIDLRPGQAMILTNRRVTHGRTVFKPRYDGADRWLQRMYTISDPWQMRGFIDERLRVV